MVVDLDGSTSQAADLSDATALAGPEFMRDERFIFHTQGTIKKVF